MELIFSLAIIFHASAIALGVGSSTLAISNFLVAIFDGQIDEGERRIMGVTYIMLRVAMVSILLTTALIYFFDTNFFGEIGVFMWVLIAVLYVNAIMMTKHWISPKIGPGLQAATWYTLGFIVTIHMFELVKLDTVTFSLLYAVDIVTALVIVNGYMKYLQSKKK